MPEFRYPWLHPSDPSELHAALQQQKHLTLIIDRVDPRITATLLRYARHVTAGRITVRATRDQMTALRSTEIPALNPNAFQIVPGMKS